MNTTTDTPTTDVALPEPAPVLAEPGTGEVVTLGEASPLALAAWCDELAGVRTRLKDAERTVHTELLGRLDKGGQWTLRVGEVRDGVQYEIKAPSPTAGTTTYDVDELATGLRELLEAGEITEEAATAACKTKVTVVFELPFDADPNELVDEANRDERVVSTRVDQAAVKAGIDRLEKISAACRRAVASARTYVQTTDRRVSVKAKRLERQ